MHDRGWHKKVEGVLEGAKYWQGSGVGGAVLSQNMVGGKGQYFC